MPHREANSICWWTSFIQRQDLKTDEGVREDKVLPELGIKPGTSKPPQTIH